MGEELHWRWKQGDRDYAAEVEVTPASSGGAAAPSAFPGKARRGLVALDATLASDDVRELVAAYRAHFMSLGFKFSGEGPSLTRPLSSKRKSRTGSSTFWSATAIPTATTMT